MSGYEALAVVSLLEFAETLQYCLKLAIKEDVDWHGRFMPLTDLVYIKYVSWQQLFAQSLFLSVY